MTQPPSDLDFYKLYLATAEKVSDRRGAANTWMLSVNSAIIGLYGFLAKDGAIAGTAAQTIWLWAIPLTGMLVCLSWFAILTNYRKLNGAKFKVLQAMEASFAHQPFAEEQTFYKADKRRSLSHVERLVPICFACLYAVLLVASVMLWCA